MPFNGSNGIFNRLYNFVADAAAGIKILAARMDGELNGIADGLSNCITRDGQSPPSADIPMGAKKLVNLGTPTAPTDAATKGYVDNFLPLAGGILTGNLSLKPTAANGTLLLYSSGTLKSSVRVGGSGILTASDAHAFTNLSEGITYLTLGAVNANMTTPFTVNGGLAAGGMMRATGSSPANITAGPGVEMSWQGTAGVLAAYDRTTATDKSLVLQGADIALTATLGTVTTKSGHVVQGILALGGSALGGISGQIQFNRSDGAANVGNISWQAGNEFRIANNNGGVITDVINGVETFRTLTGGGRFQHTQMPVLEFNRAGVGSWYLGGSGTAGDNGLAIRLNGNSPSLYFDTGSAATFKSDVTANGFILATAQVRAGGSGTNGSIRINPGDGTHSGYLEFIDTAGTSIGYIQRTIGGTLNYNSAGGHKFDTFIQSDGIIDGRSPGVGTTGGIRSRGSGGGAPAYVQFTDNTAVSEWANVWADGTKLYISVNGLTMFSIDSAGNVRARGTITPSVGGAL